MIFFIIYIVLFKHVSLKKGLFDQENILIKRLINIILLRSRKRQISIFLRSLLLIEKRMKIDRRYKVLSICYTKNELFYHILFYLIPPINSSYRSNSRRKLAQYYNSKLKSNYMSLFSHLLSSIWIYYY